MNRLLILPMAAWLLLSQAAVAQEPAARDLRAQAAHPRLELAQSSRPALGIAEAGADAPAALPAPGDARAQVLQELAQTRRDTQLGRLDSLYAPR